MTQQGFSAKGMVGARALLAWSQADLAKAANIHPSEVADFELDWREVRPAAVEAMTAAIAEAGVRNDDQGLSFTEDPAAPTPFSGGNPTRLIEASDLVVWADSRDGQAGMPELLSRLIRAERGVAASVRFPSGDSVAQHGWDGEVRVVGASVRIPDGQSGWETGTDQNKRLHYLTRILAHLETHPEVSEETLVLLEWYYFHMLRYSERPSPALHRELAKNPDFFLQVLTMVFRREDDDGGADEDLPGGPATPDQRAAMARHGYDVLDAWNRIPGADDKGRIDGAELERWVTEVRRRASELGRSLPADLRIGRILGMSAKPAGEVWPPVAIRQILESAGSETLEDAFVSGAYSSRGLITRDLREGGRKERTLSDRYRDHAKAMASEYPVTARLLNELADGYDGRAKHEDDEVEERSWH